MQHSAKKRSNAGSTRNTCALYHMSPMVHHTSAIEVDLSKRWTIKLSYSSIAAVLCCTTKQMNQKSNTAFQHSTNALWCSTVQLQWMQICYTRTMAEKKFNATFPCNTFIWCRHALCWVMCVALHFHDEMAHRLDRMIGPNQSGGDGMSRPFCVA